MRTLWKALAATTFILALQTEAIAQYPVAASNTQPAFILPSNFSAPATNPYRGWQDRAWGTSPTYVVRVDRAYTPTLVMAPAPGLCNAFCWTTYQIEDAACHGACAAAGVGPAGSPGYNACLWACHKVAFAKLQACYAGCSIF